MAPVSRNSKPRRRARPLAAVLFPAPAGPSMVTIIRVTQRRAARRQPAGVLRITGGLTPRRSLEIRSIDDGEDVVLGHDEQFLAIDRHFVAGVGGEQDAVALLDLEGGALAAVQQFAL